mmetsp:Transcript_31973/g.106055  ORF Transcript_31973/g.106055 Transcript_31973/m.106055 type:complete len:861 (+) Transcript_31973:101-2683(+)
MCMRSSSGPMLGHGRHEVLGPPLLPPSPPALRRGLAPGLPQAAYGDEHLAGASSAAAASRSAARARAAACAAACGAAACSAVARAATREDSCVAEKRRRLRLWRVPWRRRPLNAAVPVLQSTGPFRLTTCSASVAAAASVDGAAAGDSDEPSGQQRWAPFAFVGTLSAGLRGRIDAASRLLLERPVQNVVALLVAAIFFSLLGLVSGRGTTLFAPGGGGETIPMLREGLAEVVDRVRQGVANVASNSHAFPRSSDMLVLLGSIAFVLPAMSRLGLSSSLLANIALGIIIGPSGFSIFQHTNWSETLAQVGVLFFLCEMGLELNLDRLKKMWRDVFVLGLGQFLLTTWVLYFMGRKVLALSRLSSLIFGSALSLSSSAFVLQILGERKERGTRHGRAAFGILLLQDLAVPLLLVLLPMLRDLNGGLIMALPALKQAVLRTILALGIASITGRLVLGKLFSFVATAGSPVALRCLCFFAIFGICYIFEAFGLPSTLGAFLAGVLLSETAYRQQVDAVISPVREDFFGVFFITVGFLIDLQLVCTRPVLVLSTVSILLLSKSFVTTVVCKAAGLSLANALQIGLTLSQAGEFSLVMLNTATSHGAFSPLQHRLLVTSMGISLAMTPFLAGLGRSLAEYMEQSKSEKQDMEMVEPDSSADVVVYGYGRIGQMITQVLDERLIRWIAFDISPAVVNAARRKDLPVFYGDCVQMTSSANFGDANQTFLSGVKMVVITSADKQSCRAAITLKKYHPDKRILAAVLDIRDAKVLEKSGVTPIMPTLPEDSMLLNLPIGVAVLNRLGYTEEIGPLIREKRLELIKQEEVARQELLDQAGLNSAGLSADFGTIARWYSGSKSSTKGTADV